MSTKYNNPQFFTNDLYCAAYLVTSGCELLLVEKSGRRITFVFLKTKGSYDHRRAYLEGDAIVNVQDFQKAVQKIRQEMAKLPGRKVKCQTVKTPVLD